MNTDHPNRPLESLVLRLQARADHAYGEYIERLRRDECLGWEAKVKRGVFGQPEMQAHKDAERMLGRHMGLTEAAQLLRDVLMVSEWRPIETAPRTGQSLLLGRFNDAGEWRTLRGRWVAQSGLEKWAFEPDHECVSTYWPMIPTHWIALPEPPDLSAEAVARGERTPQAASG